MEPTVLKLGDPCSSCGGEYRPAKLPTKEQYHRAFHAPEPSPLPPGWDTMDPDQRAEHGDLFICRDCGHQTRFKVERAPAPADRQR